jgi:hypothetical protein
MTSILTINHHVDGAKAFIDSVKSAESTQYVFTARPQPWANSSGGADDTAVEPVNNSVQQIELEVYRDLLYGKLISNTDVIHVIPRYNWVANTVFANYDHLDPDLYSKNFYVITSDILDQYNIFKCIDNAQGVPSTVKPTLQATKGTFRTGDGYTWKYMYTIDIAANSKFTSSDFIPITANTEVIGNSTPGTIDVIRIANGGAGYSVVESGILQSIFDNVNVKLPDTSSSADNYYSNSSIYLKSGFGAGQVREIVAYNGTSKTATLAESVDSYLRLDIDDAVLITGGDAGETVSQIFDDITFTSRVGFFNSGDTIIQSGSAVAATVLSANTTRMKVSRLNKTQTLVPQIVFRSAADAGTIKTDKVNISNSSALALGIVISAGSGYTANALVSITSNTGFGGAVTAVANATGKIESLSITAQGNGYSSEPFVAIAAPIAQTFNANTDVVGGDEEGANNVITIATANVFVIGDRITYSVSPGNTTIVGLSNNTTYFVQFANDTVVALSNSANTSTGNRIQLTPGLSETGHNLQGLTAFGRVLPRSLYATNTAASATLTSDYANGDFIRVGENANSNIRRIESVNSTIVIVNSPFSNTITSANTFKLSTAALPATVTVTQANGVISNTNLTTITLSITNTSVNGALYIVGEKVELIDSANLSLNANGIISYSNTSTLYISGIVGTWVAGERVRGDSSLLVSDIVSIDARPNVTVKNPSGTFTLGQPLDFRSTTGANTGIATLIGTVDLTQNSIEYDIGPTVKILGDGVGAVAVATVNTSIGTGNTVSRITMIEPGNGYTSANIQIYANSLFGSGAIANPVISPILGHGSEPIIELGSRYAAITAKFNNLSTESLYYPSDVSFRKIGIIENPRFANLTLTTTDYTRTRLELSDQLGSWITDEVVVQDTSNATGIVVSGNSSVLDLRDVRGVFVVANTLYGYSSGSTANVITASVKAFEIGETFVQEVTGATGRVVATLGNTVFVSNVAGQLANNFVIAGSTSNAEATISAMTSSDGLRDFTTSFAVRFNQTARLTLNTPVGTFQILEYIEQDATEARARIINTTSDLDLVVTPSVGLFSIGETITNSNTAATGKVVFANSSYVKLTAVSNNNLFASNNDITNGTGSNATIDEVKTVLIVSDIQSNDFGTGLASTIIGANSGAQATLGISSKSDLIRNTGKVLYVQSSNSVINRTANTVEEIRLTIKF